MRGHTHAWSHLGHPHGNMWKRDRKRGRGANWSTKKQSELGYHSNALRQTFTTTAPSKEANASSEALCVHFHPFSLFPLILSPRTTVSPQLSLPPLYLISFLRLQPLSSFLSPLKPSPSLLFNFLSSLPLVSSSIFLRHPIGRINLGKVHFCKIADVEAFTLQLEVSLGSILIVTLSYRCASDQVRVKHKHHLTGFRKKDHVLAWNSCPVWHKYGWRCPNFLSISINCHFKCGVIFINVEQIDRRNIACQHFILANKLFYFVLLSLLGSV